MAHPRIVADNGTSVTVAHRCFIPLRAMQDAVCPRCTQAIPQVESETPIAIKLETTRFVRDTVITGMPSYMHPECAVSLFGIEVLRD